MYNLAKHNQEEMLLLLVRINKYEAGQVSGRSLHTCAR